jgi:hypothetical protein
VACSVAATVIFVVDRKDPVAPARAGGTAVTEQGVSLTVDGVSVTGPPGVAPVGTAITATTSADKPSGKAATMFSGGGAAIQVSFDRGVQPALPLSITFPYTGRVPDGAAAVLLTKPSGTEATQLIPATFDLARHTITATVNHLSSFWAGFFDFGKMNSTVKDFLGQTIGLTAAKPSCAGQAAKTTDGGTITLDGDVTGAPVWPCVRVEDGEAVVTLTPNSPLPWRIRATPSATLDPPGTVDSSKAVVLAAYDTLVKNRPYAEGLLVPGVPLTYRLPTAKLPGVIAGQADVGTYLGMALLFGVEEALDVFNLDLGRGGVGIDALRCLGDAVEAAHIGTQSKPDAIASFAKATMSCVGTAAAAAGHEVPGPVKVVIGILTTGISLVVAGLQGAALSLTGKDKFTVRLTPHAPPVNLTAFAAEWLGHTRQLTITADGRATEHIDSGCCIPVVDLTFRLSQPRGTADNATVTATVTSVELHDWTADVKAPKIGQTGTVRVHHGVLTEPFTDTIYCDLTEANRGTCGA